MMTAAKYLVTGKIKVGFETIIEVWDVVSAISAKQAEERAINRAIAGNDDDFVNWAELDITEWRNGSRPPLRPNVEKQWLHNWLNGLGLDEYLIYKSSL